MVPMGRFVLDSCDTTQKWVVFLFNAVDWDLYGICKGEFFLIANFFNSGNFFKRGKYTYLFFKVNLNEIENM